MAGSGGNFGGLFCVFFLLLLVAMLAAAALVLQTFTWMGLGDEMEGPPPTTRGPIMEPESVIQAREALAMLQDNNGRGPRMQEILESNRESDYRGDDRVWTFGIDWSRQNRLAYYDIATGRSGGYYADMVNAVCQVAGKNCRMVSHDNTCWETNQDHTVRGGPALHARWFDACVGYAPSVTRRLTFDFTHSLSPAADVNFYTLRGNPYNFDWKDLRGKKIGFLDTWYSDVDCVARNADKIQGAALAPDQIAHFETSQELYDALQRREIDAGFFTALSEDLAATLMVVSDSIANCALDGEALMVRKDSKVREWWDPAMESVLGSYEYREICKDVDDYYNWLPGRSAAETCRSDF